MNTLFDIQKITASYVIRNKGKAIIQLAPGLIIVNGSKIASTKNGFKRWVKKYKLFPEDFKNSDCLTNDCWY